MFLELRSVIPITVQSSFYVHGRADSLELFIVVFVHYLHVLTKTHSQLARMQMISRFPKNNPKLHLVAKNKNKNKTVN